MAEILIIALSVIVWINRGLYDPSAPLLTALFLKWVYGTTIGWPRWIRPGTALIPVSRDTVWNILPWVWSILVIFRNDLLYVAPEHATALRLWSFGPLLALCFHHALVRAKPQYSWLSVLLWTTVYFSVFILSPNPHIDVFRSNTLGVDYFLQGINPYTQVYPDIYKSEFDVKPGFLYWPGALVLQSASRVLFGDIRVILLAMWMGGALFLRNSAGALKPRWVAVWCSIPFLGFGFEQAWLDPVISACAAAVMFALSTRRYWLWALAVVVAATVKQYGALLAIFSFLWILKTEHRRISWKWGFIALVAFVKAMIVFVLWDPHAFYEMTVSAHTTASVRADALNFTAFWLGLTGKALPGFVQVGFTALGFGLAALHVWKDRLKHGLQTVPEAWAIAFGFSIFFGKFAFCNYHWLLISFLILSSVDRDRHLLNQYS